MNKALPDAFIGQLKDRVLGVIENDLRLVFLFQRFLRDLVRGPDQLPQHRLAANHFRVVCDVGRMRQAVGEVSDETDAADRLERVFLLEFFANQDGIDFAATFEERDHRGEDSAMRRHIKIFRPQQLDCLAD